jgi:hypothetical protein
VLAQQHRKSFYESVRQWESLAARVPRLALGGGAGPSSASASAVSSKERFSKHLRSLMEPGSSSADLHQQRQRQELRYLMQGGGGAGQQRQARQHAAGGDAWSGGGASAGAAGAFGLNFSFGSQGMDMEGTLQSSGLQPGQSHTPQRIGRDQHPLMDLQFGQLAAARGAGEDEEALGVEGEVVVGVAATKHFSVALTAKGEVGGSRRHARSAAPGGGPCRAGCRLCCSGPRRPTQLLSSSSPALYRHSTPGCCRGRRRSRADADADADAAAAAAAAAPPAGVDLWRLLQRRAGLGAQLEHLGAARGPRAGGGHRGARRRHQGGGGQHLCDVPDGVRQGGQAGGR